MRTIVGVVAALGHHYRRNRMLEDELFLIVRFQYDGIFVKRTNTARKLDAAEQVNGDLRLVFAGSIEERVLNVLCRLVFHLPIFLLYGIHTL